MRSPGSITLDKAAGLFGRNFFGVEETIEHFGVNPTRDQIATLSEIPFSEAVLKRCKDTHILVAVFPLSIIDIRCRAAARCGHLFSAQSWYRMELFANERGTTGWQLIHTTPFPSPAPRDWREQQTMLGEHEDISTARLIVYIAIGYYWATGERLFERIHVRTSSTLPDGRHIYVGSFDAQGIDIAVDEDDYLR